MSERLQASAAPGPAPSGSLLRRGDFLKLWAAQTVSLVGTQVTQYALPLTAILALRATPLQVGLLAAAQYLPFLVISLPVGAWVDRLPRRPVMVAADAGRAVVLLAVPAAYFLGVLHLALLYPVALVAGCLTVFFDVANQSYLPSLVEPERLVEGNARLELSLTASEVSGPGLSGLLVQLLSAPVAILADVGSYVGSAVLLLLIGRPEPPIAAAASGGGPRLRDQIAEGLRFVVGTPALRLIGLCTALSNLTFGGMILAILLLYAARVLRLPVVEIGVLFAVGNVGALAAALVADRVSGGFGIGPATALGAAVGSVGVVLLPLAAPPVAAPLIAAGLAAANFGGVLYNVNQVSLRQALTPAPMQGRMNATMRFIVWGPIPLGAAMGGFLGGAIGLRQTLAIAAAIGLAAIVPPLLSPIRSVRTLPEAPGEEGRG